MITPARLHDRFLELAAQALDFGLPPADTAELDRHLASCPSCARIAAALRSDQALVRHPAALLPSRRVDDAVYGAIAGRDPRTSPQRLLVLVAATVLLLVALMGVAAAGAFILRTWQPTVVVPSPSLPVVVVDPSASPAPSTGRSATIPPMFDGGHGLPVAVARRRDPGSPPSEAERSATSTTPAAEPAAPGTPPMASAGSRPRPWTASPLATAIPSSGPEPGLVDVAWGPGGFVAVGIVPRVGRRRRWRVALGGRPQLDAIELPDAARARPSAVTWTGSPSSQWASARRPPPHGPRPGCRQMVGPGDACPDAPVFNVGGYIDTGEYRGWGGPADVTAADGTIYAVGRTCDRDRRSERDVLSARRS